MKDIRYVINYDFPKNGVEDYIHRIGRTARGEAVGVVSSVVLRSKIGEHQDKCCRALAWYINWWILSSDQLVISVIICMICDILQAYTFFSDENSKYAKELCGVLMDAEQQIPEPLYTMAQT